MAIGEIDMKKVIVLNASPRKNWNTAQMLKSAMKGAQSTGAEVKYVDLYDLNYTGCRGCMLCKRKNVERCRCYWKDDLTSVITEVYGADTLLIGTPIYFGRPSSRFFAFVERLHFPALSYDDYGNYFTGSVNVGLFVTMNVTREGYDNMYQGNFEGYAKEFRFLNGEVSLYPVCNTLQVSDYSKFSMSGFSETDKRNAHEKCFPEDLKNAYVLGAKLGK